MQQPHMQGQHAQLPQQVQQHGHAQQAQQARLAQQAQEASEPTTDQQSTWELAAHRYLTTGDAESNVASSTHSKQSCLSGFTVFQLGKKKSSGCNPSAVSQSAATWREGGDAAAAAGTSADSTPHSSSSKKAAMQKLKSWVKKVRPSCMCATDTRTASDLQQEQEQQQQSFSTREIRSNAVQDKVIKACRQVQLPADISTIGAQRQALPEASDRKQCLSKLRGVFRRPQSTALISEQAVSDSARDYGAQSQLKLRLDCSREEP